jgi:hypothetical protein
MLNISLVRPLPQQFQRSFDKLSQYSHFADSFGQVIQSFLAFESGVLNDTRVCITRELSGPGNIRATLVRPTSDLITTDRGEDGGIGEGWVRGYGRVGDVVVDS